MTRRMLLIGALTLVSLVSVKSTNICFECQCMHKYYPSPLSINFIDVTCNATDTMKEINFEILEMSTPLFIRDLVISGFDFVKLDASLLSTNSPLNRPPIQRRIQVANVSHLVINDWWSFTNYSFINISRIEMKSDLNASSTEIDSLLVKNSVIQAIHPGNMFFKVIGEKVIFINSEIKSLMPQGVKFVIGGTESTFLIANSKVGKHIAAGSVDINAETIVITKTHFNGAISHIRLNGTKKIVLTKNHIVQNKPHDFFDLYSPNIIFSKNILSSFVNNIKKLKVYG